MKKIILAAMLATSIPATADVLYNESAPIDPLLYCSINALNIYNLPPRIAITLGCSEEIQALEQWAIDFMGRTGLTQADVEYIIAEQNE